MKPLLLQALPENLESERGQPCPREPHSRNSRTRLSALLLALICVPSLHGQWLVAAQDHDLAGRAPALCADDGSFLVGDFMLASLRQERGERALPPPAPEVKPAPPKPSEWFGGEPWAQWSRLTGDWGGIRSRLQDDGLELGGSYTFDTSTALSGGLRHRGAARGLLDFYFTLDPQPLLGIEGGKLFAQYIFRHGPNGWDDIGDLQGFDNMDAGRLSQAEEFWYEQRLFSERLRVKAGQVDANTEFGFVEAGAEFLSSSAGFSPTLGNLPTYPDPRLGVNVFVYPTKNFYVGAGVYGKSARDGGGFANPYWIAEVGVTKPATARTGAARVALGVWHDSARLDRFDGGQQNGASGWYALAEQRIWREHPDDAKDGQGLSVFFQYGDGDGEVSAFAHHASAGVLWDGPIPRRDHDSTGLCFSFVRTSRATGSGFDADEASLEWFYSLKLAPFFSLKPDLQWIRHPGGSAGASDAVVGTVRITADF